MARVSARIRNRNSSTPKRVSLSHDAASRTPRTAPVKLQALREYEEMPGAFPGSSSPPAVDVNKQVTTVSVKFDASTPKNNTPIKPAEEEMHPRQHQQSTAKPLEEARWLGFSNMHPNTEPPKQASKIAILQGTPSKPSKSGHTLGSPKIRFTFGREHSLELSPEAKQFMDQKREEALKIREQMIANGEGPKDVAELKARKIATPKGKKGRFSEVHLEHFKKLESIAGHASSFRTAPKHADAAASEAASNTRPLQSQSIPQEPPKSLKRSPSKAELDESDRRPMGISQSKLPTSSAKVANSHALAGPSKTQLTQASPESSSPSKRVKRSEDEHVSTSSKPAAKNQSLLPPDAGSATPSRAHAKPQIPSEVFTFDSPTQASVARAASIKAAKTTKIPAPGLPTPSKVEKGELTGRKPEPTTPLLARTPSKVSVFGKPASQGPKGFMSPLLLRTPMKATPNKGPQEKANEDNVAAAKPQETPLLARTPLKGAMSNPAEAEVQVAKAASSIPLLSRSPAKIGVSTSDASGQIEQMRDGVKHGSALMNRFHLLRSSPMKSILRSPQRLYSNDPAKVAAGTHLASPAGMSGAKDKPTPASVKAAEKHVEFSSSTKAGYERGRAGKSSTSSKSSTPTPDVSSASRNSAVDTATLYPVLPTSDAEQTITPQKRRQTAGPGDFTFTTHGSGIIFGRSPNAPASAAALKIPSTIRHISSEAPSPAPATGSKKRKFEFENEQAVEEEMVHHLSDKENGGEEEEARPAKRARVNAPAQPAVKPAVRRPTLGVKPKKSVRDGKDKKPTTISMARLNALAQPKRKV
ncbi:hypothetical protein BDY17DRAFT_308057 [Neohortaea acidophila]|uniref:Erythromycin esterase n=1 Tax=Neohortaea acidophila TaxID=245834 RepID=A0A6A6Q279_9PEZI|nr:uncharacterized protein BDY17DRAFT_308057 [Neohortaea acidophila]KAF2486628.1 hypothetical protein BDY17DRAFT_308057 [Neohortaea acidophila]